MPNILKRLELNGFKSFAQRTILDFPEGITAVVGPNGSGKSNIVDAIRWLLGEREARSLRGGQVQDLIFAGTPKRPRQGLAQAALHFDNKNGHFPVDFTEVSVSRQVGRDGSNKYLINKSEVRLKDLVDFFAQARLGTKGLVVITQGNSDLFIKSQPNDRREMIEEMLGLREYQIKKIRAENQLKNTEINLEKVKALINEILPHLRSLKRQTGRWEKREEIETELKNLEDRFFGSQIFWLRFKNDQVQKEIDSSKAGLTRLKEEEFLAEKHQKEVEANEPKERQELKDIKIKIREILELQAGLQKELGRIEARLEIGSGESGLSIPGEKLVVFIKQIKQKLEDGLNFDVEDYKIMIRGLIEDINSTLDSLSSSNRPQSEEIKKELNAFENKLEKLGRDLSVLRDKEATLEKSQEKFYESFKGAVTAVEVAKSKIDKQGRENQRMIFEKERIDMQLEELRRRIDQSGRNFNEFSSLSKQEIISLGSEGLASNTLRDIESKIFNLRGNLASIGEIDEAIVSEAKETESRYQFLKDELADTEKARSNLIDLIGDLDEKIKSKFNKALVEINSEFNNFFRLMFGGGSAHLKVKKQAVETSESREGDDLYIESRELIKNKLPDKGVEIEVNLPRKRIKSLEVLSGGERSLVGIAALFALISVSPPPFLVLDEVDAALDEKNARRFAGILKEFSKKTQFIIVTHNRATMEAADILYGVTLNQDGSSKILSLKLESIE